MDERYRSADIQKKLETITGLEANQSRKGSLETKIDELEKKGTSTTADEKIELANAKEELQIVKQHIDEAQAFVDKQKAAAKKRADAKEAEEAAKKAEVAAKNIKVESQKPAEEVNEVDSESSHDVFPSFDSSSSSSDTEPEIKPQKDDMDILLDNLGNTDESQKG
jgi:hypothetical protein